MNEPVLANRAADWRRLKMLVLDSVSSPITKRVYNLGLDEFFEWFGPEPRPGFTKATVSVWRVANHSRSETCSRSGRQWVARAGAGRRHHAYKGRQIQGRAGWELAIDTAGPDALEYS